MNFAAVEQATRYAWPAVEEQPMPYGILRFANGYTRRANSLVLSGSSASDFDCLRDDCEAFFSARSQPVMIRVPSLPSMSGLDSFLEINGYASEAPSMVMARTLSTGWGASPVARRLDRESWLDTFYTISGQPLGDRGNHQQLISQIEADAYYTTLDNVQGLPACCALAIHYHGVIGIYNVATAAMCRRQQFATQLLSALLKLGSEVGASYAYLQVEDSNLSAINLYEKLGFRELYRYRYRVKKTADEGCREKVR